MLLHAVVVGQYSKTMEVMEAHLKRDLRRLPDAQYRHQDGLLIVTYHTVTVPTPESSGPGKTKTTPLPSERPTLDGFVLRTYEFDYKRNQAQLGGGQFGRSNPKWIRDYGEIKLDSVNRQLKGEDRARNYEITWGSKVSPKLLDRIRKTLERGTEPLGGLH